MLARPPVHVLNAYESGQSRTLQSKLKHLLDVRVSVIALNCTAVLDEVLISSYVFDLLQFSSLSFTLIVEAYFWLAGYILPSTVALISLRPIFYNYLTTSPCFVYDFSCNLLVLLNTKLSYF